MSFCTVLLQGVCVKYVLEQPSNFNTVFSKAGIYTRGHLRIVRGLVCIIVGRWRMQEGLFQVQSGLPQQ